MSQEENIMRVYEYIRLKISQGLPPTVREIAADLGIRSTSTVHRYLAELCQRGYIEKELGHNRSIRLVDSTASVPVPVMGKVAAGVPITAVENVEGYVAFGARYDPSELFALRVQGESMKKIGIGLFSIRHAMMCLSGWLTKNMLTLRVSLQSFG